MASSTLHVVVFFRLTLLLLLLLLFFSFCITINDINNNAGRGLMKNYREEELGSRPPLCKNRCMSCKPCMATLVAFPRGRKTSSSSSSSSSSAAAAARYEEEEEEDESYYLLAWKCQCGNKLFQP